MSKIIIDEYDVDKYGDAARQFPEREMDNYDLMGEELADFLRETMPGTGSHQVIVEVV